MNKANIFFLIIFLVENIYCQSENNFKDSIKTEIQTLFNSQYGSDYSIDKTIVIDYAKKEFYPDFSDPYNTLEGCALFSMFPVGSFQDTADVNYFIGVYKNKSIIWLSAPIVGNFNAGGHFDGTFDINNDGKVDILFYWWDREFNGGFDYYYLNIISWDGENGKFINQGDEDSYIVSNSGFQYVDLNGDGVNEIICSEDSVVTSGEVLINKLVYSWNRSTYGHWPDSPLAPSPETYPSWPFTKANNFIATVRSRVEVNKESQFEYNYVIKNDTQSIQSIFKLYFKILCDTINGTFPYGWSIVYYPENNLVKYDENLTVLNQEELNNIADSVINSGDYEPFLEILKNQKLPIGIKPGKELDSLKILSNSFPSIVTYYFQGPEKRLEYTNDTILTDQQEYNDILKNSVSSFTLGPSNNLLNLTPKDLIDSLILYNIKALNLNWILNQPTADKYSTYFTTAKSQLQQNNITSVKNTLNQVLNDVDQDSTANLTSEAYALLRYNTEYLLNNLPEVTTGFIVKLNNSSGDLLTGGSLKYYEGGWIDAVSNGDGTFSIATDKQSLSLRMNYEFGSQTVSNVPSQNNTYTFRTVNTTVELKNSSGNLISEEGNVQYYAGGWRDFGSTINGTVSKELLPANYSFRMTYGYANNDKQQDVGINPSVVFQTVNSAVQLQNSQGELIDEGTVKYYAGGWRDFGTTLNGVAAKELLPNNYSFRMTYAYASNDKQQDIGVNPAVIFQTVNTAVQLQNSQGQLIDEGTIKYYAAGGEISVPP